MNVLLCDDHAIFAESLGCVLEANGMSVVGITHHPEAALEALATSSADVCTLDVGFGDETIFPYLPRFGEQAPQTRLVLLAASLDDAAIAAGRAAGVAGFIVKTQSIRDIVSVISRANDRTATPTPMPLPPRQVDGVAASGQAMRALARFLTTRERQVLSALVSGADTTALARNLHISPATARSHVQNMIMKLNVHSRHEAATTAVRHGLVDPETGDWLV